MMRSKIESKKRLLLICNDVVGKRMAGPAIRYVEMAKALARHYEITLVAPCEDGIDIGLLGLNLLAASPKVVDEQSQYADFVVFQGDALVKYPFLKRIKGVLIADMYCPTSLEYHQSSVGVAPDAHMQIAIYLAQLTAEQLKFADHFICASEKQRDFWLGGLAVAGRINCLRWPDASHANLQELISLVPFGLPDQPPVKDGPGLREFFNIPQEDFVAVWGGGIYQWFDPLTPIRAIHRLVAEGQRVHLVFMGISHPNPGIHAHSRCGQAIELANELGLTDRFVHFNFGWVDYGKRQNFFLEADVGISAHFDNPETRFAFRTRMLDYIWCGLPIVTTQGDVFAESLRANHLGLAVGFEDIDGWYLALKQIKDDYAYRLQCKENVTKFCCNFTWSSIMQRFAQNVERVGVAADRVPVRKSAARQNIVLRLAAKFRHAYAEGGYRRIGYLVTRRMEIYFKNLKGH